MDADINADADADTAGPVVLTQINLVVSDMDAALAFYRRLGLKIHADSQAPHAEVTMANGFVLEFDTKDFVTSWDSGWRAANPGGGVVLGFALGSRHAVDALYDDLTGAGYRSHQVPYDAFWGARYAIVDDPDRNSVGLMSPIDDDRRAWPPSPPPTAR